MLCLTGIALQTTAYFRRTFSTFFLRHIQTVLAICYTQVPSYLPNSVLFQAGVLAIPLLLLSYSMLRLSRPARQRQLCRCCTALKCCACFAFQYNLALFSSMSLVNLGCLDPACSSSACAKVILSHYVLKYLNVVLTTTIHKIGRIPQKAKNQSKTIQYTKRKRKSTSFFGEQDVISQTFRMCRICHTTTTTIQLRVSFSMFILFVPSRMKTPYYKCRKKKQAKRREDKIVIKVQFI